MWEKLNRVLGERRQSQREAMELPLETDLKKLCWAKWLGTKKWPPTPWNNTMSTNQGEAVDGDTEN